MRLASDFLNGVETQPLFENTFREKIDFVGLYVFQRDGSDGAFNWDFSEDNTKDNIFG